MKRPNLAGTRTRTPLLERPTVGLECGLDGRWWWIDGDGEYPAVLVDDDQHSSTCARLARSWTWSKVGMILVGVTIALALVPVSSGWVHLLEVLLTVTAVAIIVRAWEARDRLQVRAAAELTPTMLQDRGVDL